MIGTVLQNKYTIEKKIGEGGFGKVYRGYHEQLKRPVAVKVLGEKGVNDAFRVRFLREAESMAKLTHSNIVAVYDYAEHQGVPYMVMEYVDGPTLLELVNQSQPTMPQVCSIAAQICQGMSYAHRHGIIHRDLTLRNIMVSKGEQPEGFQVKILDFGLAKLLHEHAETTGKSNIGTPYYMAPEQLRNEAIDGRVDIFAFGVGLARMVNGRFPFEAEHPAALMYIILQETELEFAEGVPEAMKDIVQRCLEKDPRTRANDFGALIPEFEGIRRSCEAIVGVTGTITGLSTLADRSSKRNPYLNRVMIKHSSEFFGRSREIRKIYSRLDAPHPQSISIVGDRKIGKSSLLNYIYHPRNRRRYMENHENTIFIYLDFQRDSEHDVPTFIDFLFSMFAYECGNAHDYTKHQKTLDQLKAVIEELNSEGKRIVILMDEFEAITRNKNFEESFFSYLRALANSYRVAYVTSSHEDLQKMCHAKDISDSPFFNIFSNLPLRPLTREEAIDLIRVPSKAEAVPLERHAEKIIDLAGYFPLFLQIACSSVFEYLVDDPDGEPDWGDIETTFMDEVDQHYRFVWERMDEPARENLGRIAAGKTTGARLKFVNEQLERRGYLVESSGRLDICSSSFKGFVMRQAGERKPKRGFLGLLGRGR
jgi:serine/threonine protein kinase